MFRILSYKILSLFAILLHFVWSLEENVITERYRQNDGAPISLKGYRLDGSQFKNIHSTSFIRCGLSCLAETQKCVSYNFYGQSKGLGRCELNSNGILSIQKGIAKTLDKFPDAIYVQTRAQSMKYPESCVDHYKRGISENGLYHIRDTNDLIYPVFCDFNTEPKKTWTLFMSQSFSNRMLPAFQAKNLTVNYPVNEERPKWDAYRVSLARMENLKRHSTHWRITCNMAKDGITFVDYVRAKLSDFDIIKFQGIGTCMPVEYINVMNHQCYNCTSAWWQLAGQMLHHDTTTNSCDFGATPGASDSQDVFGYYQSVNSNFKCSSSNDSTTNHWFGRDV